MGYFDDINHKGELVDTYLSSLKEFRSDLVKMRDQELDRFVFGSLSDKEIHEIRGAVLALSKVLVTIQNLLEEYVKNADLPYNVRILEEVNKKYKLSSKGGDVV